MMKMILIIPWSVWRTDWRLGEVPGRARWIWLWCRKEASHWAHISHCWPHISPSESSSFAPGLTLPGNWAEPQDRNNNTWTGLEWTEHHQDSPSCVEVAEREQYGSSQSYCYWFVKKHKHGKLSQLKDKNKLKIFCLMQDILHISPSRLPGSVMNKEKINEIIKVQT